MADTESMHENMTRLRMRMMQQKLANERERLQRPSSESSGDGFESQVKLQQAMLKRQELLDRIRNEQTEDRRPKTYSPRRRYTPSPVRSPSRRSLPDINNKTYYFENTGGQGHRNTPSPRNQQVRRSSEGPPPQQGPDMSQVKHVIEHQFRPAPAQQTYLPPIQGGALTTVQQGPIQHVQQMPMTAPMQPTILTIAGDGNNGAKPNSFNKGDFMDMMMLQNAQMHHMVMQQMMLQQLPGGMGRPNTYPAAAEPQPMMQMVRAPPAQPSMIHHHIQGGGGGGGHQPYNMPPMDYRGGGGSYRGPERSYASPPTYINDDGTNYYSYH